MKVILYDGECGFCAASVRFVWKRDVDGLFSFAALQSEAGRRLLRERGIPQPRLDTFYYLEDDRLFERSEAALRVCRQLPRLGLAARFGLLVPRGLRDWAYDCIARNRHRILAGKACEIPPPEVRARFLED